LCGIDQLTGKSFDHRKQWILDRIKQISEVFAVDVCAYAIMSNHFHLVLYVDVETAENLSFDEVIDRWLLLFKGPPVAQKYKAGSPLSTIEQNALASWVEVWRDRLQDLSWFMRCLNENIARRANAEDQCKGRFWEGRFHSQALLDEAALVSCMAYVDLNPIRANLCRSLDDSAFTSIQERLKRYRAAPYKTDDNSWLKSFSGVGLSKGQPTLPLRESDYFALVDWTGRAIRDDKRGAIPSTVQPILQQLGVHQDNWVTNTRYFGSRFHRALGRINQIRRLARRSGQQWVSGLTQAGAFYL
jgi:REP element-mobilizing transposase RayT